MAAANDWIDEDMLAIIQPWVESGKTLLVMPKSGFTNTDGIWRAAMYDPETGTDYRISLQPIAGGALQVDGRWGMPVMTRSMRRSSETNIFCIGTSFLFSMLQTNLNMTGGPQMIAYVF